MKDKVTKAAHEMLMRDIYNATKNFEKDVIKKAVSIIVGEGWTLESEDPKITRISGGRFDYEVHTYAKYRGRKMPKEHFFSALARATREIVENEFDRLFVNGVEVLTPKRIGKKVVLKKVGLSRPTNKD